MTTKIEWQRETRILNKRLPAAYPLFTSVGLRAGYRCEYCGVDVMQCAQVYRGAEWDHILPRKVHKHLDTFANLALACASCHHLKNLFDPGEAEGNSWKSKGGLTDEERALLIQRVRAFLEPRRKEQEHAIHLAQQLLRPSLGNLGSHLMDKSRIVMFWSDEDQVFVAEVPDLPGCMAHGATHEEALTNVKAAMQLRIDTARECGNPVEDGSRCG